MTQEDRLGAEPLGTQHWPTEIRYVKAEKRLEVEFDGGARFSYPAEGLSTRRYSAG